MGTPEGHYLPPSRDEQATALPPALCYGVCSVCSHGCTPGPRDNCDGSAHPHRISTPSATPRHCRGCPYFLATPTHVTTPVGEAVNLTCGVRMLGDRQVSWIRRRDLHVLTTDSFTYTSDPRFSALHQAASPYWVLHVARPALSDAGVYECQVSAQPKIFRRFTLQVVEPRAVILGAREVFMRAGSDLNITCLIKGAAPEATPVTWLRLPLVRYGGAGGGGARLGWAGTGRDR
ncbi:hypothetical protein O3P69_013736 [Scylla paramamosain]|uniref:Ig-like domain-containing protein n=1 Tax=Scylla paramamosain TaxID=85552 RepID=A0AAW0SRB1_SCYPA